jgi:hypothetical protein
MGAKRPRGRRSSRSRQACRQARSRWRPDDREVVRRRPSEWTMGLRVAHARPTPQTPDGEVATPCLPRGSASKHSAVGLLTAAGGQSPEVMSISSARDVNVGCRSGVEVSWRRDRGEPKGSARRVVQRGRRSLAWTRSEIVPLRSKGAEGASRSQDQRAPLDGGPGEPVGPISR